jgi:hypothetical protein
MIIMWMAYDKYKRINMNHNARSNIPTIKSKRNLLGVTVKMSKLICIKLYLSIFV